MANPEHLDIIKQGVKAWNRWRQKDAHLDLDERAGIYLERELRVADLNGADLAGANLAGANLGAADLRAANLSEAALAAADLRVALLSKANLSRTRLTQASLSGADLSGATLRGTFLYEADLKGADLSEAYLRHTNLNRANLSGADLTKAQLSATIFAHVDLSEVKGLHSVSHDGPSEISVSSIYLSKGNIPDIFLRDTGLPDSFIDYIHSLTKKPLDFYSCFISYSSKDGNFVRRLHADLQNNGVRCWFAEKDLKIGEKIRPRIDESIHLSDKLLLVLSQYSVASQWVEQEVETALAKERKEDRIVLFPIRLDQTVMDMESGWPALVRNTRNIGDLLHHLLS